MSDDRPDTPEELAEVAAFPLPAERFRVLAEKYQPPPSWYEGDGPKPIEAKPMTTLQETLLRANPDEPVPEGRHRTYEREVLPLDPISLSATSARRSVARGHLTDRCEFRRLWLEAKTGRPWKTTPVMTEDAESVTVECWYEEG